jgi:hypothetical protein
MNNNIHRTTLHPGIAIAVFTVALALTTVHSGSMGLSGSNEQQDGSHSGRGRSASAFTKRHHSVTTTAAQTREDIRAFAAAHSLYSDDSATPVTFDRDPGGYRLVVVAAIDSDGNPWHICHATRAADPSARFVSIRDARGSAWTAWQRIQ